MKKFFIALAIAGFILSPVSFADNQLSKYYSTQHPNTSIVPALGAKAAVYPYTDITIVNYSYDVIFATVPGAIFDKLYPNAIDHIYNDNPNVYWTRIRLLDPSQFPIFDQNVCRQAVLTIYGAPGSYTTYLNSNAC